jgi:tRNA threonylcarbamoyladenosine biosynthesis protein TsaB
MKLLALDTSSIACSVALQIDDRVSEEHVVRERAHTGILMPMLKRLLGAADCRLAELDAIVLGNGPGSFIGMRIGASVAQGLAQGSNVPLVPVSSLAAVAMECFELDASVNVLVAQDARMNEVYLEGYAADESGMPIPVSELSLQPVAAIQSLREAASGAWLAAGDGWYRYPQLAELNGHLALTVSDIRYPRARCLLAPGEAALLAGGSVDPAALVPAYVRQTVARVPESA